MISSGGRDCAISDSRQLLMNLSAL